MMDISKLPGPLDQTSRLAATAEGCFEQYDCRPTSHQNAIDLIPGWTCSFPPEMQLQAGHLALYADPRIAWAIDRFGSLADQTILEIGPLEGMHTFMLNRQSPRRIDAVEANRLCYLRCLVTDQILKLDRANFLLGDAMEWLQQGHERYDLIVASGVLYHMGDPVRLLELMAASGDAMFLWTHYYRPESMPEDDPRHRPFTGNQMVNRFRGVNLRLYERGYGAASRSSSFCGGPRDRHYWMHRDDILTLLDLLGFSSVEIDGEDESHPGGPCFSVFARRPKI